jgi:peptide deformylase
LREISDKMFETMYAYNGVGLAANQVGLKKNIAVIDLSSGKNPEKKIILVNPNIIEFSGKQTVEEGCLSLPGFSEKIERYECVTVMAQDLDGKIFTLKASGYLSEALQHEIDHLSGKLYIHKLSPLKRDLLLRKVRKQQKQARDDGYDNW